MQHTVSPESIRQEENLKKSTEDIVTSLRIAKEDIISSLRITREAIH